MVNNFKADDIVTWGSGDIRGRVLDASGTDTAKIALAADYKSPCGHVWPAGLQVNIPFTELRHLQ